MVVSCGCCGAAGEMRGFFAALRMTSNSDDMTRDSYGIKGFCPWALRLAQGQGQNDNNDGASDLVFEVEAEAGLEGVAALTGVEVVLEEVGGEEEGLAELRA